MQSVDAIALCLFHFSISSFETIYLLERRTNEGVLVIYFLGPVSSFIIEDNIDGFLALFLSLFVNWSHIFFFLLELCASLAVCQLHLVFGCFLGGSGVIDNVISLGRASTHLVLSNVLVLCVLLEDVNWRVELFLLFIRKTFCLFDEDRHEDGTDEGDGAEHEEHAVWSEEAVHDEFHGDGFLQETQEEGEDAESKGGVDGNLSSIHPCDGTLSELKACDENTDTQDQWHGHIEELECTNSSQG